MAKFQNRHTHQEMLFDSLGCRLGTLSFSEAATHDHTGEINGVLAFDAIDRLLLRAGHSIVAAPIVEAVRGPG